MFTAESVSRLLDQCGLVVAGQHRLEASAGTYLPVPASMHPRLAGVIREKYPSGLFTHQALGLKTALSGRSVCLSTATASGKSLVFMAAAADRLLRDPSACVVVFYPARALIQDQIRKWEELLKPMGIEFGYIDGGVPTHERVRIFGANRLLLMTPDVAHAWLLPNVSEAVVASFLDRLQMVILDEAHVYDGVFGTNFSFFMRRLRAVSNVRQCVCCTATLGNPGEFVATLTGFQPAVFGPEADGSPAPAKTLLLARVGRDTPVTKRGKRRRKGYFDVIVDLVRACAATATDSPFLGFADSRRMVERIVSASAHRPHSLAEPPADQPVLSEPYPEGASGDDVQGRGPVTTPRDLLPYRAGYEEEDRKGIQDALTKGELRGVISTSALELGLDVGSVDLVILMQPPNSSKAFWQRIGRAGRVRDGVCVILDTAGSLDDGLSRYLNRPVEPNRLYLDNRYLQYTNALCAATELSGRGLREEAFSDFDSLPESFVRMLANELDPTEAIPPDLSPLKQRAMGGAHREFPLRSAIERDFQIVGWGERPLGSVTYSQALREAYPGAVYYYMARPYRVIHFDFNKARIRANNEKHYTTDPILQRMAFPRWPDGLLGLWLGQDGAFVTETEMQVSERCVGFWETRGSMKERHEFGTGSPYYSRPLNRFFETTGVAWYAPGKVDEQAAQAILEAFCHECGVQERDVGLGQYSSRISPTGSTAVHGWCIYDTTYGSLHLTSDLALRFREIVRGAIGIMDKDSPAKLQLEQLLGAMEGLNRTEVVREGIIAPVAAAGEECVVVARGEQAVFMKGEASEEVIVEGFRFTPRGIVYDLRHPDETVRWQVEYDRIQPIHGVTALVRWNLLTGEEIPISADSPGS